MDMDRFVEKQAKVFLNAVLKEDMEIDDEMIIYGTETLLKEEGITDHETIDNTITKVVDMVYEKASNNNRLVISHSPHYPIRKIEGAN